MANAHLATVEYGRDTESGEETVLVTFAIETDVSPLPTPQDFNVEVVNTATGDVGRDVAVAKATLHRLLRELADQTRGWA